MKRFALVLCIGLLAVGASAQELLTDGGFDNEANWFSSGDKTGGVNSFDWSLAAWLASPPASAGGTYGYYTDGICPAAELDKWWANPGSWDVWDYGMAGPDDMFAGMYSQWGDLKIMQGIAPVADGANLTISLDYITPLAGSSLAVQVYGMLLNNPDRTPFFSWDGTSATPTTVLAGPDVAHTWGGGVCTGAQLFSEDLVQATEWTNSGELSFQVQGAYDALLIQVVAAGASGADLVGVDNISMMVVAASQPGDANGDGVVDLTDLGILATNWGRTDVTVGAAEGDFDDSGAVDLSDLGILATNWGAGTEAVPEPATMSLLGLGGLALLKRTRKS